MTTKCVVAIHSQGRYRETAAPSLKLLKLLTPKHCRRHNPRELEQIPADLDQVR
jgi:hypothetical protein